MTDTSPPRRPVQLRGRAFKSLVLAPETPLPDWFADLDEALQRSPTLFDGRAIILDLGALRPDHDALQALRPLIAFRSAWWGECSDTDPAAVADGLATRGHAIERVPNVGGGMGGIAFHAAGPQQGDMEGAACWRADGTAIGLGGGFARAGVRFLPEVRKA